MIIEGLDKVQFIEEINKMPNKDGITATMLSTEFITKFQGNYDYIKDIDNQVINKSDLFIGMTGARYIEALNKNIKNITDVAAYTEVNYIIPGNRGSEYNSLVDLFYDPSVLKLANGKTLIGCISRGGATFSRENFTVLRNADGTFSGPNLIGFENSTAGTYDSHSKAAFIEKDNVIYAFHERLTGVSPTNDQGHDSPIIIKKSLDGGINFTEITRINDLLCYPKIFLINGEFYLLARKMIEGLAKYVSLYKSIDNCETWVPLTDPFIGNGSYWAYNGIPRNSGNEINIIIYERITQAGGYQGWPHVAHIRSTDGITYYNTDRTWSKNVQLNGSITQAELTENCLISTYTNDNRIAAFSGGFIKNDKLYSLICYGQPSLDSETGLLTKITYESAKIYEGSSELIDVSDLVNGKVYINYSPEDIASFYENGDTFDIVLVDTSANNDIKLYNYDRDGLINRKLLRLGEISSKTIGLGTSTFNSNLRSERLLVMTKLTGNMLDLHSSYTDLIVFVPN